MRSILFGALLLAACQSQNAKPTAAAPRAEPPAVEPPAVAEPAECTLATPLVEGVPGSPGHLIPSSINPNGQSELSAHMRLMVADLKAAREAILRGGAIEPLRHKHSKIRCAWPTNPAERNQNFDVLAESYLLGVSAFDAAPPEGKKQAYNEVIAGCRACHEKTCSGALAAIAGLPF